MDSGCCSCMFMWNVNILYMILWCIVIQEGFGTVLFGFGQGFWCRCLEGINGSLPFPSCRLDDLQTFSVQALHSIRHTTDPHLRTAVTAHAAVNPEAFHSTLTRALFSVSQCFSRFSPSKLENGWTTLDAVDPFSIQSLYLHSDLFHLL